MNFKQLIKDSFIYGLGIVFSQGIIFFTLPVYTSLFVPSEYGKIDLVNTVGLLFNVIFIMGMDSTQGYYYMKDINANISPKKTLSSILRLRIVIGVLISLISILILTFFKDDIFGSSGLYLSFMLVVFINLFNALINNNIEIFRLKFQPWTYNLFMFIQAVISVFLSVFFIVYYNYGINGYFLGFLISSLITSGFLFYFTRCNFIIKFEKIEFKYWISFLKYGVPLGLTSLAYQFIISIDRFFILDFKGSHELGIYSAGVNISMASALIIVAFRKAWWPYAMELINKDAFHQINKKMSIYFLFFAFLISSMITVSSPFLVQVFTDLKFINSWIIVSLYSWVHILFGFILISGLVLFKEKKTSYILFSFIFAGFLNFGLNFFLVNKYGGIGASLSSVFSLGIVNLIFMFVGSFKYNINWSWLKISALCFISLITNYLLIEYIYDNLGKFYF